MHKTHTRTTLARTRTCTCARTRTHMLTHAGAHARTHLKLQQRLCGVREQLRVPGHKTLHMRQTVAPGARPHRLHSKQADLRWVGSTSDEQRHKGQGKGEARQGHLRPCHAGAACVRKKEGEKEERRKKGSDGCARQWRHVQHVLYCKACQAVAPGARPHGLEQDWDACGSKLTHDKEYAGDPPEWIGRCSQRPAAAAPLRRPSAMEEQLPLAGRRPHGSGERPPPNSPVSC